jgi:hypothetical protein
MENEIRQGRDVTHVLNVKVSRQGADGTGNKIRAAIFSRIANRVITKQVLNQQVTVTWRPSATSTSTSAYYFCDSPFTNRYVLGHTKILLRDIIADIDGAFNYVFTTGVTGLAFMVTNPALYRAIAPDQFDDVIIEDNNEDEGYIEEE